MYPSIEGCPDPNYGFICHMWASKVSDAVTVIWCRDEYDLVLVTNEILNKRGISYNLFENTMELKYIMH